MNENEKKKYFQIIEKQKEFFSSEKINSEKELDKFIKLIENYISEFKIKENNIYFMIILFRLYNLLISKKITNFDSLEEKISKYLFQISEIDIFYVLNFISKYDLEKSFQEDLTKQISFFFYAKGIDYLSDNFKKNKNISFELFQLSLKLIDNLFLQNKELKNDQQILELIKDNEQSLKHIKIIDLSLKIKEIYNKNQNNEKYLDIIIELYQNILNLISDKNEVEYINDFDTLYKLGDNDNYLPNVLTIMNSLYAYIHYIDVGENFDKMSKKEEFECNLEKLTKSLKESININQEYFKDDYNDEEFNKIIEGIDNKYNDDKEENELIYFCKYILQNYPPITMSMSIDEFLEKPNVKKLVVFYSKSYTKKYEALKNKEKIRKKIFTIVSEMFNNNIELNPIEQNGGNTEVGG